MIKKVSTLLLLIVSMSTVLFSGETIHVKAPSVTFEEDMARLKGDATPVWLSKEDLVLEAASMTLHKIGNRWRKVVAQERVHLILEDVSATSGVLEYDLDIEEGAMREDVVIRTTMENSTETILIWCDRLKINRKLEKYEGYVDEGNIRLLKGENTEIFSKRFILYREENKIELLGDVYINDRKNNRKMWADKVLLYTEEDRLIATNVRIELEQD